MSSTPLTMVGNLTADPTIRTIATGDNVTTLRMASNSRYRDATTGEWRDAHTLFMTVTCWRALAVNSATSLRKGDRIVAHGRLRQREFEVEGVRRVVVELEADAVGPDLTRFAANLQRPARAFAASGSPGGPGTGATPPEREDDKPAELGEPEDGDEPFEEPGPDREALPAAREAVTA